MEPCARLRDERKALGFAMSMKLRRSVGVLDKRKFWLVERVWFWIGIWSWDWIRALSCDTVIWGFSIEMVFWVLLVDCVRVSDHGFVYVFTCLDAKKKK